MAVLKIDKNGFINGTKTKYKMKVKALQPVMIRGQYYPKDSIVELEGADLSMMLSRKQVEPFVEEVKEKTPPRLTAESQAAIVAGKEKKMGPKKSKKAE